MCIASFVMDDNRFIMTFSRDENPLRTSLAPHWVQVSGGRVFCPLDEQAGGTWIGYNRDLMACLQNGAWQRHIRKPSYKRSRGHILMDILSRRDDPENVLKHEELIGIEPFTLSIFECSSKALKVYRYDENSLSCELYDLSEPVVIASCTLYDDAANQSIAGDFMNSSRRPEDVFDFHDAYRIGNDKNHFTDKVSTVSITQFVLEGDKVVCRFTDTMSDQKMIILP